ncbi:MAG: HAD family hydrolase [Chloroflexota bacterium]|nr:HAD family hydrolase [Chloroflexota bacterium]
MSRIQAVCFDLDDTLRDPGGARGAIRRTCERLGPLIQVDPARLFAANGEVWQRLWPEVEDGWTHGFMTGEAVTTEAWRRTLQACGHHDPATARRAAKIHLKHAFTAHRLFDDARILLDAIEPDLGLAVVTNGASDTQRGVLRALGIEGRFHAVIVSGEVGVAKPDPAVFELALDVLDVPADHAWHVGDNVLTDVAGARAAGLTAVWLNRDGATPPAGAEKPDLVVSSLTEFGRHVSAALAGEP